MMLKFLEWLRPGGVLACNIGAVGSVGFFSAMQEPPFNRYLDAPGYAYYGTTEQALREAAAIASFTDIIVAVKQAPKDGPKTAVEDVKRYFKESVIGPCLAALPGELHADFLQRIEKDRLRSLDRPFKYIQIRATRSGVAH